MDSHDVRRLIENRFSSNFNGDEAAEMLRGMTVDGFPDHAMPLLAAFLEGVYWTGYSDGASAAVTD